MKRAKLILLVEDNQLCGKLFTTLLEAAIDCRVHWVRDGISALDFLNANRPDLIQMDIQLPGISGWETIKAIAAQPALDGMPICVVTASGLVYPNFMGEERERVAAEMLKPIETNAYLQMILRWLYGGDDIDSVPAGDLIRAMTEQRRNTTH